MTKRSNKASDSRETGKELPTDESGNRPATVGFSPAPTLYKLHWDEGNKEYVQCGADILLNGLG